MKNKKVNTKEFMKEANRVCPINPFVRYKNIAINNLHCAINRFLFSLYYWFGLLSQTRHHIKNVKGATVIGKVYFVKEPVIIDIHLQEKS